MLPEYQLQGELVISVPSHRPSAQELGSVQAERELVSFAYTHTHSPNKLECANFVWYQLRFSKFANYY